MPLDVVMCVHCPGVTAADCKYHAETYREKTLEALREPPFPISVIAHYEQTDFTEEDYERMRNRVCGSFCARLLKARGVK